MHDTHKYQTAASNDLTSGKKHVKIAYIGGGSREWAVKLMGDLALSDCLTGLISLYDTDYDAAAHNRALSEVIFSHPQARSHFHVQAEHQLQDALREADFVVISIEPGPVALRHADVEIPANYGILQSVGDTTGPGGILRALRCVPIYERLAAAIMEHCPEAWVINYTNPMAICVATLYAAAPNIKAFGCCHEVFGTQTMMARLVDKWFHQDNTPRQEIELDIAGVNHFTWATRVSWKGNDLLPRLQAMIEDEGFFDSRVKEAIAAKDDQKWFAHDGLIAYDFLRRFGVMGAAGDRHLAEFVPWYLQNEKELHRWGVVLTPYSWRLERSRAARPSLKDCRENDLRPSGEEGLQQIEALLGLRTISTNINLPNRGQLRDYPLGAIVETYAQIGLGTITPLIAGELPPAPASLVRRTIEEQKLTLTAGLTRDPHLAFQAILTHPLVHLSTDKAWAMFQEMLGYTREMLPGWRI